MDVRKMANRKPTYQEMMAQRDKYKHELDVLKQDRVTRQAKNSVFLNLFTRQEYYLQLYKELFPEDSSITEADLELVTLDNALSIHPYNDLGLLARNKLIVLSEAQSTWSMNIVFRLADYYFDSAMSYLKIHHADLHGSVKVDVPDVEAFVIYTGKKKIEFDEISLNQRFKTRVIHGDYRGDIIEEYMDYCRIWDANVLKARTPEEKQLAVVATINECIEKNYLAKYLEEHRPEVERIMMTMFSPDYVKLTAERTQRIKGDISYGRYMGISDDKIKESIIQRYELTPTYAQNFMDDDSDPEDSRPWAV